MFAAQSLRRRLFSPHRLPNVVALLGLSLGLSLSGWVSTAVAVPPGTADDIRARLQPFGNLCRAGEDCGQAAVAVATGPLSGQGVYDKFCFACHTTGVGGAPKIGDAADWTERQAKGMDTLWDSLVNGINTMPAKGTCMGCSDDELQAALDYMLEVE